MNTETKTEWRLVPVDATEEVIDALEANGAEGTREQLASDYKVGVLAAPTPQSSEPGVWMIEHTYRNQTTTFTTHHPEDIQQYLDRPELYKVTPFYDYAKPCERCAEYVRYCPECGGVGEVASPFRDCCPDGNHAVYIPKLIANKLAALETSIGELNDSLGVLDICQIKPLVTAHETENKRLVSDRTEEAAYWQIHYGQQIKQLEAKIEQLSRESSACDMIEEYRQDAQTTADAFGHLQRQFEAVNQERDDWIACHAKIFRELQEAKATIAQQAEQLAAAQKDAERYRWIFDNCKSLDEQGAIEDETQLDAGIAAQKEGK